MSDVLCLVSCLCWAARRTGREIMIRGCCCASHSVSRTRARPTSCLAGHAIPGSGTAAISKFLSACFLPSQQNCMCVFSCDYIFGLCFLASSQSHICVMHNWWVKLNFLKLKWPNGKKLSIKIITMCLCKCTSLCLRCDKVQMMYFMLYMTHIQWSSCSASHCKYYTNITLSALYAILLQSSPLIINYTQIFVSHILISL